MADAEPVARSRKRFAGNDDTEVEDHPAFAVIGFTRFQGNPGKLFGSHLSKHAGGIRLRISKAQRQHHLSQDWIHPTSLQELIEVDMSFTQFAELLTSLNMGEGVPCTLRSFDGKSIPEIPSDLETEQERIAADFKGRTDEMVKKLKERLAALDKVLAKKVISKSDRHEIKDIVERAIMEVGSNIPFVQQSFTKSVEKVKQAAKSEIDGFLGMVAHNLGVASLKDHLLGMANQRALGSGNEEPPVEADV